MSDLDLAERARDVVTYQAYGDVDNLLGALADRIEVLEARLARVTDDSMAERIERALRDSWTDEDEHANAPAVVLATVRAVAAGEQPESAPSGATGALLGALPDRRPVK